MVRKILPRDGKGPSLDLDQITEFLMLDYWPKEPPIDEVETQRRTIQGGPLGAYVFVPAPTQEQIDDPMRDWPPGYPPELHYMGLRVSYFAVVEWGYRFDFRGRPIKAEPQLLSWLDTIRPQVESLLDSWRNT